MFLAQAAAYGAQKLAEASVSLQQGANSNMSDAACPQCNGKGHFDTWGNPCDPSNMHRKGPCHTCNGACRGPQFVMITRCGTCEGKGGFDTWSKPAIPYNMHFKSQCTACSGRGFKQVQAAPTPAAPVMGGSPCPGCAGKGGLDENKSPCDMADPRRKYVCFTCGGSPSHPGFNMVTRCGQCEGKGGKDGAGRNQYICEGPWNPCGGCAGRGFKGVGGNQMPPLPSTYPSLQPPSGQAAPPFAQPGQQQPPFGGAAPFGQQQAPFGGAAAPFGGAGVTPPFQQAGQAQQAGTAPPFGQASAPPPFNPHQF
mmetsp:Transcript_7725/g.15036  ORF Transcript_7725/g.15036 Transcript_7725/m.15036 type:complete len:310 (-) Transcript_7725:1100-2029(-)